MRRAEHNPKSDDEFMHAFFGFVVTEQVSLLWNSTSVCPTHMHITRVKYEGEVKSLETKATCHC